jgi:integrase
MARRADLLTALAVENATTALGPGLHYDGGGLYLQVSGAGGCSWIYRYRAGKKLRDMGLGSADVVSLKAARKTAARWRALRTEGIDPIAQRAADKAREAAEGVSFKHAAVEYIAINSPTWRNQKHRDQWESTLKTYVYPIIGETGVGKVDTNAILSILQPQWLTKAETMGRVRGRIEAILDFAKAKGWRRGENVARWAGHLKDLLPRRKSRKKRIQHHPSMPYPQVPDFIAKLRKREGVAAHCLEFTILNASRTVEATGAKRTEFDLDGKIWTIPAGRIKGEREHRVPLPNRSVEILRAVWKEHPKGDWAFPGNKGKHLSNGAMLVLLDRMGHGNVTVHGFRSSFRSWSGEQTNYPREICELALAHVNDDDTEEAYLRTDFFEKRRQLMSDWAKYALQSTNKRVRRNRESA